MRKLRKRFDGTLFDVASGTAVLAFFGIAALVVIAVVVLVILAIVLIVKAARKNQAAEQATLLAEQKVTYDNADMGLRSGETNETAALQADSSDNAGAAGTDAELTTQDGKVE